MRDHWTPSEQVIRTRRSSVARGVILLTVAGFLCSGLWTIPCAVGAEGGGQQADLDNYEKMATQTFTEEQWLQMLRQRVHQPISIWYSMETGIIEQTGTSFGSSGLNFENSRSQVFEQHLRQKGLLATYPLIFLSLFGDEDPETVLTGAAAYTLTQYYGELKPQELDKAVTDQIAAAVREKLLTHRDVRVRWAGINILGQTKWMLPQDIAQGMNDKTNEIRVTTVSWASTMRSEWSWKSDPSNTEEPNSPTRLTREQFREREALLAETLLDHLNDTHFYIRETAADVLRWIFMGRVSDIQEANPARKPPERPRDFDWVRSEWARRVTTQKVWKNWWKQHGPKPAAAPAAPKTP